MKDSSANQKVSPIRWLPEALLLLLAYPAWVRGGTHSGWQTPMPWLALMVWVVYLFSPVRPRSSMCDGNATEPGMLSRAGQRCLALTRDPVLYAAVVFLALILTQWFNAGRALRFDYDAGRWVYLPARIPWLPSAILPREAREMWLWFFPAWSVLLIVRNGLRSRPEIVKFFRLVVANGLVLALFGLVQYLSGTDRIYWMTPLSGHFFASFGYSNHAASYFLLCLALTLGITGHELVRAWPRPPRGARLLALLTACGILVLTAHLTFSRAAIVMTWSLIAVAVLWVIVAGWRFVPPAGRVTACAAVAAIAAGGLVLATWVDDAQRARLEDKLARTRPAYEYSIRGWQYRTAIRMWRDHPWFGVGGWGYRHLVAAYMEPEQYTLLEGRGRANVHNDGLQFLAEFGVVGVGMLLAAAAFCLRSFFRRRIHLSPIPFFVMFGLAAVVAHSLLDLPFRSPAVMFLWCAMLAAVGVWEVDAVQRQVAALKGNLASRGERSMFKNNVFFA